MTTTAGMYASFRRYWIASGGSGTCPTKRMFVQRLKQLPEVRSLVEQGSVTLDKVTTKNGKSGRYVVGLPGSMA